MKRSWTLSISVVALVCGAVYPFYDYIWIEKILPVEVRSGSIVQTIVASGHVESPHRIHISAQVTGTISDVPVSEGQSVKKGQMLFQLEDAEAQAALKQAQATLQLARNNLRQISELKLPLALQAYNQGWVNYESAKQHWMRSMALYDKGFIGEAAKDDSQQRFRIAESQLSIVQQQFMSLQVDGSEMSLALANVNQAHAAVEVATARLSYHHIRSPRSGVLISRNVQVGDGAQPGKILMTLSPDGTNELVLQIDEKNIQWLKINQLAQVVADAFPDQKFKARLSYINPGIDSQRGSVTVKLQVLNAPIDLKQDMTVSVDIEILRADDAILIPMSVVQDEASSRPWVMRIENGVLLQQFITLGLRNQAHAQVLTGLKSGDLLAPLQAGRWKVGRSVRILGP